MLVLSLCGYACNKTPYHSSSIPLEEKLTRQFALYDAARENLTNQALNGDEPYSRKHWERLLQPDLEYRLTDEDLETLRRNQRRRIEASAGQSRAGSAIDMEIVRSRKLVGEFSSAIPKGALLHVHPNGSLHPATIERLLGAANPRLHPKELKDKLSRPAHSLYEGELDFLKGYPEDVRFMDLRPEDKSRLTALFFLPEGTQPFSRFEAVFEIMSLLRSNPTVDFWGTVYDDFAQSAHLLGIRHVEFTKGFEPDSDEVAALARISQRAMRDHGVSFRWNFAFTRAWAPEKNLKRMSKLLALPARDLISGIDMLGPEKEHPALDAGQQIYGRLLAAEKKGETVPHRTMHAAGLGEIRNIRDAMIFGAERLGHASRINEDPVTLEYAARRSQAIEVNLVSNVRLGYTKDYATHPFLDMLRLGLRVSLSTDDEGILGTDIVNEYAMAIASSDVSYDELKQMTVNSVETSFLDADSRARLVEQLKKDFDVFEQEWIQKMGRPVLTRSANAARIKAK